MAMRAGDPELRSMHFVRHTFSESNNRTRIERERIHSAMAITATTDSPEKVLVIGIGNEFRNDDGVGMFVARKLRKLNLSHIKAIEHSGEGGQLAELWKEKRNVILIDATASGAEPGTIFRFNATKQPVPTKFFHYSTHDFSVAEAIEVSRVLSTLPARLLVYGIEGVNYSQGSELSPIAKKTAEYVLDLVIEEVARFALPKIHAHQE
jgi:hydrogenase maturation protease